MNAKNTLPISEARKKIFDIAEDVQTPGVYYVLTEKGKPKAVVMSAEEFELLKEDLELLSDPGFAKRMEAVEKEFERGDFVTLEVLKKELNYGAKKELVVMERAKKQNKYRVNKKKR